MEVIVALPTIFLMIFLTFELANLVSETLWQKSISLLFRLITTARLKGTLWLAGESRKRASSKSTELRQSQAMRFAKLWNIDTYGNLFHAVLIISFCIIISICTVSLRIKFERYLILWGILIILGTLVGIIFDLLAWLPISTTLFFESLDMILEYRQLENSVISPSKRNREVDSLYTVVRSIKRADFVPYFVARFSIVILLTILSFSAIYFFVGIIEHFTGFIDTSGQEVHSFWDFLYSSVMLTATFGPVFEPVTWLSRFLVGIHALLTLCLLVIVITFFSSLSEERIKTERSRFLQKLNSIKEGNNDASP